MTDFLAFAAIRAIEEMENMQNYSSSDDDNDEWNETESEHSDDSDDDTNINIVPLRKRPKLTNSSSPIPSTSYANSPGAYESDQDYDNITWSTIDYNLLPNIPFTVQNVGVKGELYDMYGNSVVDYFKLFLTNDILNLIVNETNRNANQQLSGGNDIHWRNTNRTEIKRFFGIIIWMSLVRMPTMSSYWSQHVLYRTEIGRVMSKHRFRSILRMLRFTNYETANRKVVAWKLQPLVTKLRKRFIENMIPGKSLGATVEMLHSQEDLRNEMFASGVKVYKILLEGGYTYNIDVDTKTRGYQDSASVVTKLVEPLRNSGRVVFTDSACTSVPLAHSLLKKKLHLVGLLRSKRKLNCPEVAEQPVATGDIILRQSNTGVVVAKWKEQRDVLMLSTKHKMEMRPVAWENRLYRVPDMLIDFAEAKSSCDVEFMENVDDENEIKAYSAVLLRGLKWYKKIAIDLILGSAMFNAYLLYKEITNRRISFVKFLEHVHKPLLQLPAESGEHGRRNVRRRN